MSVTIAAVVAASTLVAQPVFATPAAVPTAPKQQPGAAVSREDAVQRARQTGKPVEITAETSETRQILANPNGSLTLRSNVRPVRVKKDNAWWPIDTTLQRNTDGSLSAKATALDVTFSTGGHAPLVTVRHNDKSLAMSWPAPLPTPSVSGDTAIYPSVLPGVDLHMTAMADTYSQVLVVRDATAAAQPALRTLRMNATTKGLDLTVIPDGSMSAKDASGTEVFHGTPPSMWDSRTDNRTGPRPTATDQGGGRVTRLGIAGQKRTASATELSITPDPAALTGPDVVYPLYIDPSMGVRRMHYLRVTDNGWTPRYDDFSALAQVGYCGGWTDCEGFWRARSYFQMDTTPLQPRNGLTAAVWRAEFYATQVWSADHNCNGGQPTTVFESGGIGPGMGWPGPAHTALDTEYSNAGGPCPANNLIFDVSAGINRAAAGGWTSIVFGLLAANENERLQWKKFDNNPLLEVDFSFPPNNATGLRVAKEVYCNGSVVTSDARPTFYATAADNNNPPLRPALHFHPNKRGQTLPQPPPSGPVRIDSGAQGQWTMPTDLENGDYRFRVYVDNNPGSSQNLHNPANDGYSSWHNFTVDASPPSSPYFQENKDYPEGFWGAPSGAPSAVRVLSDSDTVGLTYSFDSPGAQRVPTGTDCNYNQNFGTTGGWKPVRGSNGKTHIPIPAELPAGPHTLYVKSFDKAHNLSSESAHQFYVTRNSGQTTQRFEAENLTRSQPPGQNISLSRQDNCCDTTWSGGAQLYFGANAPDKSFTVNFDVATGSDYQVGIGLTSANDYGRIQVQLDGRPLDWLGEIDHYNYKVIVGREVLGNFPLAAGTHSITITTKIANPASTGLRYIVGLDYITLTQTTRYEAETNLRFTTSQPAGQNIPIIAEQPALVPSPDAGVNCACSPDPSQGRHLRFAATAPGQSFDLNFTATVEADYALGIALVQWRQFGQIRISLDGKPLRGTDTTAWDGYSWAGAEPYLPLGGAHLTTGTHKITITVVGKNPEAQGYFAAVDYITVVPINNVTAADFTSAMNNDGISPDGTAASLDFAGASLSVQTLAAAGYQPGANVTVNGATFTMPAPRSDGHDNVVAMGQRIPVPVAQQVKASAVGLLVNSTCGGVPSGIGTITFTDNTTKDSRFPAVHDWAYTDSGDLTLPYRNYAGVPDTTVTPRIQAIFAPSDPTKTIKSITLPHYGSGLLPGNCAPALHVFSIAPRTVATDWLGAWAASADTAGAPAGGAGFANQTVRTVIRPSTTGASARVRIANSLSAKPVTINAASLAAQASAGAATLGTPAALTFGGQTHVTIPAGGETYTDPIAFPVTTGGTGNLVISLHIPTAVTAAPRQATAHQPTYLATGNAAADATGTPFATRVPDIWYVAGVEVSPAQPGQGTVAVLGDTRAATSAPADGPTWVDALPAKLQAGGKPVPGGLVNLSSTAPRTISQAAVTTQRTILKQPNFRTVIVTLGRDDLLNSKTHSEIRQKLTELIHPASPIGIRNASRTDGSGVHVILATVAPLELDETSPVEQQRRLLNADIISNFTDYGAHEIIDIASAVQDPAQIGRTRTSYLDPGTSAPNAAYYDAIAQFVATEITRFPPGAQL
jgi:hypothetical protein